MRVTQSHHFSGKFISDIIDIMPLYRGCPRCLASKMCLPNNIQKYTSDKLIKMTHNEFKGNIHIVLPCHVHSTWISKTDKLVIHSNIVKVWNIDNYSSQKCIIIKKMFKNNYVREVIFTGGMQRLLRSIYGVQRIFRMKFRGIPRFFMNREMQNSKILPQR